MYVEQDSVVGIGTSYELEGSGLRFRWGQEIFSFTPVYTGPGAHPEPSKVGNIGRFRRE
jgi:hypothetical protein